ncbi:aldo/keto reductase [Actinosynnema mirum]|uniref:Aldo/keto reductase n=1 Tax=Actinosynnema mirum (strain ATCC 29888 / DSM 43827 / JCM 3225 / NBRC 14064 / NCIMB 13271 / NRRL B-12336 / IMRU 3971 / 101) TaxID=446462 RepID=C6WBX2_ACTMD|nr:aldo/keto reductase [Actinosynnema mirum]ACU37539.1 aldo/keto reductase [Actinosynnema mirum DSM 43827]
MLGATGLRVSEIGMGCWAIGGPDTNLGLPMGWAPVDEGVAVRALERAHQLGVTLFDTADVYGHGRSERILGRLVEQVPRESLVLSSKVGYFTGTAPHGYHPGHMRRQLEQTLDNLRTDHLDVYFLHHAEFGPDDVHLAPAVEAMHRFREEGLIRVIGMRGPHRHAVTRLSGQPRVDKVRRFHELVERARPEVLAVRDNLLTPQNRSAGIFAFAEERGCGVLVNKPLAGGLLAGEYRSDRPRLFGAGDHRSRKRWFTPAAVAMLEQGLAEVRAQVGPDLVRVALGSCLRRSDNAAVLVGFTSLEQVERNITALTTPPSDAEITRARDIMGRVQRALDASGEVFLDETGARS